MKTTIQIPDSLYKEMRKLAQREQRTIKAIVEENLRRTLAERHHGKPFRLRKASFKGNGLQPHLTGTSWDQILHVSYEGRGA